MIPETHAAAPPPRRRRHIWIFGLSGFVVAVVALVALWNWDWFIPLVDSRATDALGRATTIQHLHVALGRTTVVTATGVEVANADGLGDGRPFAHIDSLSVALSVMDYIHTRQIVIPQIVAEHPVIEADEDASGKASWTGLGGDESSSGAPRDPKAGPRIGQLVIKDGQAHVALAKLKADFNLDIATKAAEDVPGAEHDKAAAQWR